MPRKNARWRARHHHQVEALHQPPHQLRHQLRHQPRHQPHHQPRLLQMGLPKLGRRKFSGLTTFTVACMGCP